MSTTTFAFLTCLIAQLPALLINQKEARQRLLRWAAALGIDPRRVRAYASGGRPIPKTVALASWALAMQPRVADARKLLA